MYIKIYVKDIFTDIFMSVKKCKLSKYLPEDWLNK